MQPSRDFELETADELCRSLLETKGVLLVSATLFRSELADLPRDHFRIGFTRPDTSEALGEFRAFLEERAS